MKQIREIIARRRPSTGHGGVENEPRGNDAPLQLSSLHAAPEAPAENIQPAPTAANGAMSKEDKDLVAARQGRDAVPRYAERPKAIADGRPRSMMREPGEKRHGVTPPPPQAEPSKPKIWDLESTNAPAKPASQETAAPVKKPAARSRTEEILASAMQKSNESLTQEAAEIKPALVAVPEPQQPQPQPRPAASGGRVKTRLLGFHSEDLNENKMDAPIASTSTPDARFPIGWLVVVDGPGRGASFTLTAGLSKIGRGTDQTVSLDFGDSSISRDNHAALAFDEEENTAYIGHGGKSNIVRLNGKPLLTTEELQDADLIRIGKTTLRYVALCGPDFRWSAEGGKGAQDADNE